MKFHPRSQLDDDPFNLETSDGRSFDTCYGRGYVNASVGKPFILNLTRVRHSCLSLPPVNDAAPNNGGVDIQRVHGPELAIATCQ